MKLAIDRDISFILVTFLIAHIFIYFTVGIVSTLESEKYITQANHLINGNFPSAPKYYYYLPIILLIAFSKTLSLGYGFVVFIQSLISAVGVILYYVGTSIVFNRKTALFSSIALCAFVPFLSWNFYLYSDSIFISLSLFLYYCVCKFEKQNLKFFFLIFLSLTIMIFTRPFGALFIPPLFIYFLFRRYNNKLTRFLILGISAVFIIAMYFVLQAIFHGGEDMDAMKPFIEEHIICFVPTNPEGAKLDLKYYDNGVRDIFYYVVHNPLHFTRLMLLRLFSFFKFSRTWYSPLHNFFLTVFIIPVYLLFFVGIFHFLKARKNILYYFMAVIVLYPLAATLQCDDWSSRFTMPVLPLILVLAAYGFNQLRLKASNKAI